MYTVFQNMPLTLNRSVDDIIYARSNTPGLEVKY